MVRDRPGKETSQSSTGSSAVIQPPTPKASHQPMRKPAAKDQTSRERAQRPPASVSSPRNKPATPPVDRRDAARESATQPLPNYGFGPGDRVEGRWGDDWFGALLVDFDENGTKCTLEWDDGGIRTVVPVNMVRTSSGAPKDPDSFGEPRQPVSQRKKSPSRRKAADRAHRQPREAKVS